MADQHRQGKRRVLTLSDRLKIIKAVEDSPHRSRTEMAVDLCIPRPTLSNIMKYKEKYLAQARSGGILTTSKRARSSQLASVDKALLDWFTSCRWVFLFFSYEMLIVDLNSMLILSTT
jgi:hypothetical protein